MRGVYWFDVGHQGDFNVSPATTPPPDTNLLGHTGFVFRIKQEKAVIIGESQLPKLYDYTNNFPRIALLPLHAIMTTSDRCLPPVISFSSENVEQLAKQAWEQVSLVAEGVSEPTIGRASGFLPSDICFRVISLALEEYPGKASFSAQLRRISRSRKGGVVYFPGKPRIGETFTIMIPISVRGNVKVREMEVRVDKYYHILQECTLDIPEHGKLVALIIDNIVL